MSCNQRRMLIVDDDPTHARVLTRCLRRRRFEVTSVRDARTAVALAAKTPPDFVILEQQLGEESGLRLIAPLHRICPHSRILVLAGRASIPRAVDAIKLGACNYLVKPAYVEEILSGFGITPAAVDTPAAERTHTVDDFVWGHIRRALQENQGNVAAAARALKMHRRTLQRKLAHYESERARLAAELREKRSSARHERPRVTPA